MPGTIVSTEEMTRKRDQVLDPVQPGLIGKTGLIRKTGVNFLCEGRGRKKSIQERRIPKAAPKSQESGPFRG